jgi:hypothetical protein
MLKVVSVSLGSSARDKVTRATLLNQEVELTREGTDGDFQRAMARIAELDGQVDAIGLGGIDLYLCVGKRKYTIRDAARLAAQAKTTPVVDGSGLKLTLEKQLVEMVADAQQAAALGFHGHPLVGAKALMVAGVDRWGMSEALSAHAGEMLFGDLIFALGIPVPIRSLKRLEQVGRLVAPIVTNLPFKWVYPTGDKQQEHKPKHSELFIWADWICGDFHYIKRNLPPRLDGKVVLTNTTTEDDVADLRARGLSYLITTTPVIDGRSFGMNVLEGCVAALIRQRGDLLSPDNYAVYLNKLNLQPTVVALQGGD